MDCREKSCEAAACWGDEDKIAGTEKSCEAVVVGGAGEKTAACCDGATGKKLELCEAAGIEICGGVRALIARVNVESIIADNAASEIAEFSAAYLISNASAKEIMQKSG